LQKSEQTNAERRARNDATQRTMNAAIVDAMRNLSHAIQRQYAALLDVVQTLLTRRQPKIKISTNFETTKRNCCRLLYKDMSNKTKERLQQRLVGGTENASQAIAFVRLERKVHEIKQIQHGVGRLLKQHENRSHFRVVGVSTLALQLRTGAHRYGKQFIGDSKSSEKIKNCNPAHGANLTQKKARSTAHLT
jgi:hypothetical protein